MSRWSEERWEKVDGGYTRRTSAPTAVPAESMTKAQLSDELERLGLPKTGSKAELQERLAAASQEA